MKLRDIIQDGFFATFLDEEIRLKPNLSASSVTDALFLKPASDRDVSVRKRLTVLKQIGVFFGLPMTVKSPHLIKNLFGWHDENSPGWQKVLNYTLLKPLLFLIGNIALVPFRFARNLLKLCVEFIPFVASNMLLLGVQKQLSSLDGSGSLEKGFRVASIVLTVTAWLAMRIVHQFGALMTSPLRTIQAQWEAGNKKTAIMNGVAAVMLYALFLPLTIYFLAPVLSAYIAPHLPAIITQGIQAAVAAYQFTLQALTPALTVIGHVINKLTSGILAKVGMGMADIGLSGTLSMVAFAIGSAIEAASVKLGKWYHSFKQDPIRSLDAPITGPADADDLLTAMTGKFRKPSPFDPILIKPGASPDNESAAVSRDSDSDSTQAFFDSGIMQKSGLFGSQAISKPQESSLSEKSGQDEEQQPHSPPPLDTSHWFTM